MAEQSLWWQAATAMAAVTTCWASAALLAATALKDWLAASGIEARVRLTTAAPAEEGGAAKTYMVRAGPFRRCRCRDHLASGQLHRRRFLATLAGQHADRLHLHPARPRTRRAAPELGRPSALDAVETDERGRQLHARAHA